MAEFNTDSKKKIITFYLPQFHTIPENDKWWGTGFTEWVNTRKAVPLFEEHYQPKTPLNENYYDLSDVKVMIEQAKLAMKYGVDGFCYYHYWFKDGKKLLEKPIENMLRTPEVKIPFCLCWANENWSRNWDGGNKEIIMEQKYGDIRDWEIHFQYLLKFFRDERYITYEGKQVLLIYKPEEIEVFNAMIDYWQNRMVEEGYLGLIVIRQFPYSYFDTTYDDSRIDYTVKFEPAMQWAMDNLNCKNTGNVSNMKKILSNLPVLQSMKKLYKKTSLYKKKCSCIVKDYDETWNSILYKQPYGKKLINGAFVNWDNTARKKNGFVYNGGTPEKFEKYMSELLSKESALNMVFINAWNEWAEGAYLEPDEKYGYKYLEALSTALKKGDS